MHSHSGAASARYRRLWWLLCALVFVATTGMQIYLAVTMTAWWAWAAAAFFTLIALACLYAAQRRI